MTRLQALETLYSVVKKADTGLGFDDNYTEISNALELVEKSLDCPCTNYCNCEEGGL